MGGKWYWIMLLGIIITIKTVPVLSDYLDRDKNFLKECKVTCNDSVLEVDPQKSICKCFVKSE